MYYLFSPLLDEKGERVVRVPEFEDIFVDGDEEILVSKRTDRWVIPKPILTMQKFEEDPLGPIKWAYGAYKYCSGEALDDIPRGFAEILWQAIVAVMERGEGK